MFEYRASWPYMAVWVQRSQSLGDWPESQITCGCLDLSRSVSSAAGLQPSYGSKCAMQCHYILRITRFFFSLHFGFHPQRTPTPVEAIYHRVSITFEILMSEQRPEGGNAALFFEWLSPRPAMAQLLYQHTVLPFVCEEAILKLRTAEKPLNDSSLLKVLFWTKRGRDMSTRLILSWNVLQCSQLR